jgi:hypothetical protein
MGHKFRVRSGDKEIFILPDTPLDSAVKQLLSMQPDLNPEKVDAARAAAVKMRSDYPQTFAIEQQKLGVKIKEIRE